MKKAILFIVTAVTMLSAAAVPAKAMDAGASVSKMVVSGEKKQKDYKYDYEYDINKDKYTSLSVKVPNIKKLGYTVTDKSVLKVRKISCKNGTAKISAVGIDEGVSYLKIYDKRNTKKNVMIKINVIDTEKTADDEVKETAEKTPVPTEQEVYDSLIAVKDKYPDGMAWGNEKFYMWKGGVHDAGAGCAAFAYELSDIAFGDLPGREHTDFSDIHVGDVLHVNGGTHFVIVLEVSDTEVIVAEGNYNRSVKWGRKLNIKDLNEKGNSVITRYPEE